MDLLSKFLASLSQGILLGREKIIFENSTIVFEFVLLLYSEGLIHSCRRSGSKLEVWLKRYNGFSLLKNVRLFPRRSKSIFCTVNDLKLLRGLFVISTTDGIMTHRRAILRGVGGKIFCSFVI